jgi:hypothetical protein
MKKTLLILAILTGYLSSPIFAHDWTYTVSVSNQTGGNPKTFYLWLPPQLAGVKGLVLTAMGRLSQLSGDSLIRKACQEAELGIVGCMNLDGNFVQADTQYINNAMNAFAAMTKLPELKHVPFASYGTSVGGIFAWEVAFAYPGRFFGVIQDNAIYTTIPSYGQANMALQVPLLVSRGSEEPVNDAYWFSRSKIMEQRALGVPASMILHAGIGHFSWTQWEARFMAMWLKKAAAAKIPAGYARNSRPVLNPLAESSGWLAGDTSFKASNIEVASYSLFSGDPAQAFWFFDAEIAAFWKNLHQGQFSKLIQTGQFSNNTFQNCSNPWQTCSPNFNLAFSNLINPAATVSSSLPIRYGVYNGPFVLSGSQIGIDPNLMDETNTGWIVAIQEGDNSTQGWERAVRFRVDKNNGGQAQSISVSPIPDQFDTSAIISLNSTASSGLPLSVTIRSGPARLVGNQIQIESFAGDSGARAQVVIRYGQGGNGSFRTAIMATDTFWVIKTSPLPTSKKLLQSSEYQYIYVPNPASDFLFLNRNSEPEKIQIFDFAGRMCKEFNKGYSTRQIPVSDLSRGTYFLHFFIKNQKYTQVWIKD